MSRYACYLAIQNADRKKKSWPRGKPTSRANPDTEIQEAELEDDRRLHLRDEIRHHNTQLADAARNAGVVEPIDYAIFQNHGYMGLYNGLKMADIHKHKGLNRARRSWIIWARGAGRKLFSRNPGEEKLRRDV